MIQRCHIDTILVIRIPETNQILVAPTIEDILSTSSGKLCKLVRSSGRQAFEEIGNSSEQRFPFKSFAQLLLHVSSVNWVLQLQQVRPQWITNVFVHQISSQLKQISCLPKRSWSEILVSVNLSSLIFFISHSHWLFKSLSKRFYHIDMPQILQGQNCDLSLWLVLMARQQQVNRFFTIVVHESFNCFVESRMLTLGQYSVKLGSMIQE